MLTNPMRVLWYIEPVMYRDNPLQLRAWLGWIIQVVRSSKKADSGFSHGFLGGSVAGGFVEERLRTSLDYRRDITQRDALEAQKFDRFSYAQDLFAPPDFPCRNGGLVSALRLTAAEYRPDIVISFSQNRYLGGAFPGSATVFCEFAPYSRIFTRPALFFDPSGHQNGNLLASDLTAILNAGMSDDERENLAQLWADVIEKPTRSHPSAEALKEWLRKKKGDRKVVLFALQPTDWLTYEGAYENIPLSGLIMRWLSSLPDRWMACLTFHPHCRLSEEASRFIEAEWPSAATLPLSFGTGVSELLFPYVDAVATISSSLGVQAALWGKPLAAYGSSSLSSVGPWRIEELDSACPLNMNERLSLLRFLTCQYCHPLDRILHEGQYLADWLARWKKRGWGKDYFLDVSGWRVDYARQLLQPSLKPARDVSCQDARSERGKPRVLLFNDTGVLHHIGCQAVSDAHARMIERAGGLLARVFDAFEMKRYFDRLLREEPFKNEVGWFDRAASWLGRDDSLGPILSQADAVIVNGEGSIHHSAGMTYLALLLAAHRAGKRTALINALLQQLPESAASPLAQIDELVVRETLSEGEALRLGCTPRVEPDSILEAAFENRPERDFQGRVVISDAHWDGGIEIVDALLEKRPWPCSYWKISDFVDWRTAVASLRTARLFITARHHGIYLAVLAGIPFVALPANTHKIDGTLLMMKHALPVCRSAEEAVRQSEALLENPTQCTSSYETILQTRPLLAVSRLLED